MIEIALNVLLLAVSVLAGFLIAKYTKDERKQLKNLFLTIGVISLSAGAFYFLYGKSSWALTLISLTIISGISYMKAR